MVNGTNTINSTSLPSLQPNTGYTFYVTTQQSIDYTSLFYQTNFSTVSIQDAT